MITYKIINTANGSVIFRDNPPAWIPLNEQNSDYAAYLKWLSEGNIPADEVTE